ncbi:MAG: HPF/RaiA family ribosome-associated protein [Flavobacteriales bacterium]|nr:HPF/RaiA family ribosome-associated protein [Flavobacteriales bacterium]
MQVQVQSIHFVADQKLVSFIEDKIEKLATFHDRILRGDVFLRLDRSDIKENKIAEVKIAVPGRELFAKKQSSTFEEAAEHAVEAVRRQISKHKTKSDQA